MGILPADTKWRKVLEEGSRFNYSQVHCYRYALKRQVLGSLSEQILPSRCTGIEDVDRDMCRQHAGQLIGEADLKTMTSRESVVLSIHH